MTNPMFSLLDRQYVSQFGPATVGLAVHVAGQLANVDGAVTATMTSDSTGAVIFADRPAANVSTGTYDLSLGSPDTQLPDVYTITWSYSIGGQAVSYQTGIEVGPANPAYDGLDPTFQSVVDSVWVSFADLFDSPWGGPNLQTYLQTKWSRGRLAQLLPRALGQINSGQQPMTNYTLDPQNGGFPLASWQPLLEKALFIEAVKHLIRSYNEQPTWNGVDVALPDRAAYIQRWRDTLSDEMPTYIEMRDVFKISLMGLSRPRVMVSGGVFGDWSPSRLPASAAARPRYYYYYG